MISAGKLTQPIIKVNANYLHYLELFFVPPLGTLQLTTESTMKTRETSGPEK